MRNNNGVLPIQLACQKNKFKLLEFLENKFGADLYIKLNNERTVLHQAAIEDNTYLITYLHNKLNINTKDKDGNTPLHLACYNSQEIATYWITGIGADINATNNNGDNALHQLFKSEVRATNIFRHAKILVANGINI